MLLRFHGHHAPLMAASHAKLHHEDSEHDEVGRLICFTGRANYTFTGLSQWATPPMDLLL